MQDGTVQERSVARLYLTMDVEPDYGRADTYGVLDRAAPFFEWLRAERVPLTAFVVGQLFVQGHHVIDDLLSAGVPLGLHGFHHDSSTWGSMHTDHSDEINRAVDAYVGRVGRRPAGYRAAAGIISRNDVLLMQQHGFRYDSSVFPMRRAGRYDFSGLPKTPFCWEGTQLIEVPFGLMTSRLPAGMTFINLLGSAISARLMARAAGRLGGLPAWHVTDLHMHNLFNFRSAMWSLPFLLRPIYLAGSITGGFSTLTRLVARLEKAGFAFGNLEADALQLNAGQLPGVALDCFDRPV